MMPFFFFKQKTAYEIRPCDWSSDVCSSDLDRRDARPSDVREVQVAFADRARLGGVDGSGRLCEAREETGPHERGTKTAHALEAGRGPRGRVREAGGVRELGLWGRPDDREQDPREDAGYGEGVLERPLRGEAQVRHDAAVLERTAGEAEAVLLETGLTEPDERVPRAT